MSQLKVPNTYVIIFAVLILCALSTWLIPGGNPQSWQIFSALYEGFCRQAGIIAFVLIIGGAFWVINSTKAVDSGIMKFIVQAQKLERFRSVKRMGIGNIVIVLVMLLFGLFGAVFGMSEETIAFVAIVIPLARSLGYDEFVGVCMVYVAAHVGFAGAMLNPFTIGIAQDMSGLPLFSGIEYRTICWLVLMTVAIVFVLWYAVRIKRVPMSMNNSNNDTQTVEPDTRSGIRAWICFILVSIILILFSYFYADACIIKIGSNSYATPYLLWVLTAFYIIVSIITLSISSRMYILNMLLFTILFLIVGAMGYGWYLPEICALFMALAIASGFAADYSADKIAKEFVAGAKDIFSAALIIGFAAGIIVLLENGEVIDTMLGSMASALENSAREGAMGMMYGIQALINLVIPSASAKAAVTMPIMAPFSDMIGISRQATVLAFQFGDGFTNMITPCSGVLMAVLSVAKIPYEIWVKWIWKFVFLLVIIGFLLLLPTLYIDLPGF